MIANAEPGLTVLIGEDEQAIRRFVRAALEAEGHRTHEADTVRRGLQEAGTRKPDLVILDPVSYTHLDVYKRQVPGCD